MVAFRVLIRRLSVLRNAPWKKSSVYNSIVSARQYSRQTPENQNSDRIEILEKTYNVDGMTNITPRIKEKMIKCLHNKQHHPISLLRQRIQDYFYRNYVGRNGNPIYAVFDNISPVVSLKQNFDNLLVSQDHPSRHPKDSYYVNSEYMLRAHTTSHTCDIIKSGLDSFLTVGDVYRRDTVDKTHFPVFHQMDGVRLFDGETLFQKAGTDLVLLEAGERTAHKQAEHSDDTVNLLSIDLQKTLVNLTHSLFGKDIEYRWVDAYFPFTHPSWELEIRYQGEWMEVLGCGILEQKIINECGVNYKAGWAFGLGLERLAMRLYTIPDVRLFWSEDKGFLNQFKVNDCHTPVTYKEFSRYPSVSQDISFWIADSYSSNDFYDLTRSVGGELVEQVDIIDNFTNPKTGKKSHTYRVTYRHMHRNLTNKEINVVQQLLRDKVEQELLCTVRQ